MPTLESLIGENGVSKLENLIGPEALSEITEERAAFLYKNISAVEALVALGFKGPHIKLIVYGAEWENKFNWLADNYQTVLLPLDFGAKSIADIFVGAGWKEKVDWVVSSYERELKPLGFNPSKTAMILKHSGWKEKIDWLVDNYQNSTYSQDKASKTMSGSNWEREMNASLKEGYSPPRVYTLNANSTTQRAA